jgi:long-chain acyl-CoA synthetase
VNPAEWLWRTAQVRGDAPALFRGADLVTDYDGFADRAARIGASLREGYGIGPGDRVALFAGNDTRYLEALYAIWWIGAVVVPVNGKLHPAEAEYIVKHADCSLAITSYDDLVPRIAPIPALDLMGKGFAALRAGPHPGAPCPREATDPVWLFYTSGTTGKPKGVVMLSRTVTTMALCYPLDVDPVAAEDAILYAAPMSHGAGIYNFMHVIAGARHVVPPSGGFDAGEILDLAPRIGHVSMFAAPTMVRRLIDVAKARALSGEGIKTVVYAGGPMYLADIIDAVDTLGPRFVQVYGQGECPMGITALSRADVADRTHPRWRERLASVGRAQSAVAVAIQGPDGAFLPPGEIGEIVVKGDTLMQGYWRNEKATAETIVDGWLRTGDMGALDEDGYLTMHDRSKDMIISGGSNIYPREVEEILLEHPTVHEVSVVGQADPEWGEVVVAFVVAAPGAVADPGALDAHCLDRIARFKRPKRYVAVEALPKNNYGKVLKTALRDMLKEDA